MEEGKNPPSTFPAIRSHFEAGEKTEALVKFPAQSHRLTEKQGCLWNLITPQAKEKLTA